MAKLEHYTDYNEDSIFTLPEIKDELLKTQLLSGYFTTLLTDDNNEIIIVTPSLAATEATISEKMVLLLQDRPFLIGYVDTLDNVYCFTKEEVANLDKLTDYAYIRVNYAGRFIENVIQYISSKSVEENLSSIVKRHVSRTTKVELAQFNDI